MFKNLEKSLKRLSLKSQRNGKSSSSQDQNHGHHGQETSTSHTSDQHPATTATDERGRTRTRKRTSSRSSSRKSSKSSRASQSEADDPVSRCTIEVEKGFEKHIDLSDHDFTKVDKHARETPSSKTKDIQSLSHHLTSPWKGQTLHQLRAIFTWIAENIRYDVEMLLSGRIIHCEPDDVLKRRAAVCDGYAGLFNALAKEADLNTWKINGHAKGVGYQPGDDIDSQQFAHAWIGTDINHEYLLIDATWGAGHVEGRNFKKKFEPFYFLARPSDLIYSHFPKDPKHQYLKPNISKEQFVGSPFLKPPFFQAGLHFVKYFGNEIVTNDGRFNLEIERTVVNAKQPLNAHVHWKGKQVRVLTQRVGAKRGPRGGLIYRLQCELPSSGEGKLQIFVLFEGNKGPMATAVNVRNTGGAGTAGLYVEMFEVPYDFTIVSPVHANLRCKDRVRFEVTLFDVEENKLPEFELFTPEQDTIKMNKVARCLDDRSVTVAADVELNLAGEWSIAFAGQGNQLHFLTQYNVS